MSEYQRSPMKLAGSTEIDLWDLSPKELWGKIQQVISETKEGKPAPENYCFTPRLSSVVISTLADMLIFERSSFERFAPAFEKRRDLANKQLSELQLKSEGGKRGNVKSVKTRQAKAEEKKAKAEKIAEIMLKKNPDEKVGKINEVLAHRLKGKPRTWGKKKIAATQKAKLIKSS